MGTIIRFLVSAPLAALVTVVIFLALYNQLSPKPFLYKVREEPGKLYLSLSEEHTPIRVCDCITFIPLPYKSETDNPWTNSEKAVKEPPRQTPPKPQTQVNAKGDLADSLVPCDRDENSPNSNPSQPIVRIPPHYPEACVKKGAQGAVTVQFDITTQGTTANVVVVQSADECLNAPAISTISRWRYPPYCTPDGKPATKTGVTVTFTFILED